MSKAAHKDELIPTNSLKNITNIQTRISNCVVKMQKIDFQKSTAALDSTKDKKSGASKSSKRKLKKSDDRLPSKKKAVVSEQPVESSASLTTVVDREHSVENVIKKYEQLQKVISDKYVSVVDRLKLDYVPFCCENLEYCHKKHYKKAPPPKIPSVNQMNLIRNSLQQSRYNVFTSLVWSLCHKEQFPGDIVLTNIVKLILTLNPESKHNAFLQSIVDQLLCIFEVILKAFPPCWLALRQSYIKFLRNTMEISSLLPGKPLNTENTIFEVVLMLLEDNLDDGENVKQTHTSKRKKVSANTVASSSLMFSAYDNEYHNMQHWEKIDNDEQTFSALSKATRIERLMQVLHFLNKMLEMDMAMWMLRYHKNPAKHIYNNSNQPLVIELFSLSEYKCSSVLVKKVMSLFSLCVEKNLDENYLRIMDRFITLLANVQNLCEIENTPRGIRYPYVGPRTSAFTLQLHKTSEVNMKTCVSTYLKFVKNLSCPFVRFEYIDIFLKRLNPAVGKMSPQKIFENFRKNRWFECAPDEERSLDESLSKQKSIVYRQDYLQFVLEALKSYCDYFALKEFFHEIVVSQSTENSNNSLLNNNQLQSHSNEHTNSIDLLMMRKNILKLEKDMDMSVKLRVPKASIPTLNICVNAELLSQYRNDLKYVANLHSYICALHREHDEDFSEMIEFLKDFAPSR